MGGEATKLRKFYLENSLGQRLSLQDKERFMWEPSGLGYSENISFAQVEYGFFTTSSNEFSQPSINGTLVFFPGIQNPYVSYSEFVDFVNNSQDLQLVYSPYSGKELYMDIAVTTLDLTEIETTGVLECPVVMTGTSPYHRKNPLVFMFETQKTLNPMRFTFQFPFQYSASGASAVQLFTPTGHFPAAMELIINGPCSDVYFQVENSATGEIIGELDLSQVSVPAGAYIDYSSRPNADGIWLVDGLEKTDLTEMLNQNVANFFTLPVGQQLQATLSAETTAADITHILRIHEYFKG